VHLLQQLRGYDPEGDMPELRRGIFHPAAAAEKQAREIPGLYGADS
jgi:hypothetical protein